MKTLIYIGLTGLVVLAGLRLVSRKLLYFPQPLAPGRAKALERMAEKVVPLSLAALDGKVLNGWILEKDLKALPLIFYFGGNAEEVSLNIEEFWGQVPANLVLVNYRGYGESQGNPTEAALKADSLAVFDTLSRQYGKAPDQCLAWGRSLGSSVASFLALERGLGGLILTCPFDSIAAVASGFYPAWLVGLVLTDPHLTTAFSPRIKAPTLILAAQEDEVIALARTQALYESLTCAKTLDILPGAEHNTISDRPGYYEKIRAFVSRFQEK